MSDPTSSSVDQGGTTSAHNPNEQAVTQQSALGGTPLDSMIEVPDVAVPRPKKVSSRVNQPRTQRKDTRHEDTQQTAEQDLVEENQKQAFGLEFLHRGNKKSNIYTLEQDGTVTSIPADVSYPCTIRSDDDTDLYADNKCFITFLVDLHMSHLLITMAIPDERGDYKDQLKKKVALRFPYTAFSEDIQIDKVDSKTYHNANSTLDCYELTLTYNLQELNTENVLVANPLPQVAALSEHLKRGGKIKCHVCGHGVPGAIPGNLKALQDQFACDRETNPLVKWMDASKNGKFIIQHNEFIAKGSRPTHYNLDPKFSFFNWTEYMIVMSIADLEEYEYSKDAVDPYEDGTHPMYVLSMAGGEKRIYLGLLDIPTDDRVRIQPGDTMLLMSPEIEDQETALFGRVSAPLPGIPVSFLSIFLHMKWLKDEKTFSSEQFDFNDVISLESQADRHITKDSIQKHKPVEVKLKLQNDDRSYRHRVAGLADLHRHVAQATRTSIQEHVGALLLGQNLFQVQTYDIFSVIKDKIPNPLEVMGELNEEQKMVYRLALEAPAGFVIVHGPPGTGKTYIGKELVKPFVLADQEKLSVLCCSASNQSVNAFAVCLHEMVCKHGPEGSYVLRVHAYDTEIAVAKQPAISKRTVPEDLRPQLVQNLGDDEAETLKSMKLATIIHRSYLAQHTRTIEHVPDDRVTQESLKLAVGTRILQLIGEIPAVKGDPTPTDQFAQLHENYRQFSDDVEFDQEKSKKFRAQLKEAREHVLANAIVICTTPALACDAKVYSPCQDRVKLIMIDEAARSTEPELLALLGFYHNAVGKVFLGDPRQLPPLALASVLTTYFQSQLVLSLQDRLMKAGIPSVMLTKQYRMVPDISGPVSKTSYGGKLTNDESVRLENRPLAQQLRAFNKDTYKRERCVVYLDVHTTTKADLFDVNHTGTFEFGSSKSRYNEAFIMVSINLAQKLMDFFPSASIAILTAYNAQYRLYLQAKDSLVASNPTYERLIIDKVDRAQGMEVDIGIVDFLVKNSAGFLKQASRNNVAVSRWRLGLYVVGTKKAIDNGKSRSLSKLQTEYLKIGTHCVVEGPFESAYYKIGDADLSDSQVSCWEMAEDVAELGTEPGAWENTEPGAWENAEPGAGENVEPGAGENVEPGAGENAGPDVWEDALPEAW